MRNPNGFGSVYKLSGRRRRPWATRITTGFRMIENKKAAYPIYKFIGYYETKSEALRALVLYNREPSEVRKITLLEVYEEWKAEHEPTVKNFKQFSTAFRAFEPLYNKPINQISIQEYEEIASTSGKSIVTLKKSKMTLNSIYKFAFRKGIIEESKATLPTFIRFVNVPEAKPKTVHKSFTYKEVDELWKHTDDMTVQVILFMIYSGVRISELADLKSENVHIKDRYFDIVSAKTAAGIRKVPIHDRILPIARDWMKNKHELFSPIRIEFRSVDTFRRKYFEPVCRQLLEVDHLPHDTRFTTATFMTESGVDLRYIQLILGHAQKDITNSVYARKLDIKVLLDAINKIS